MTIPIPKGMLTVACCAVLFASSARSQSQNSYEQLDTVVGQVGKTEASQICPTALPALTAVIRQLSGRLNPSDPKLISAETFAATLMPRCGRSREAEDLLHGVAARLQGLPPGLPLSTALESLAMVLTGEGRNAEAWDAAAAALSIQQQFLPDNDASVILTREALAGIYESLGNIVGGIQARLINLKALESISTADARKRKFSNLMGLGEAYRLLGDQRRSEDMYAQAEKISLEATEKSDLVNMRLGRDMRRLLIAGQVSSAIDLQLSLMKTAKEMHAELFKSPDVSLEAKGTSQLAAMYYLQGDYEKAAAAFRESFRLAYDSYTRDFPNLTEGERLEYGDSLAPALANFYSFCYDYRQTHPELLTEMYDIVLWQKSMITRSMERQRLAIAASKDVSLKQTDDDARRLRAEIAERTRRSASDPILPQLRSNLDADERKLASRLAGENATAIPPRPTVSDLLLVLDSRDAAVEIVKFPLSDRYGPTYRTVYGALVARPGARPAVSLVMLGDATAIETSHRSSLATINVRAAIPNGSVNIAGLSFWASLESAVRSTRHIFLSPDGILNQTAFLALKSGDQYVIDTDYDIRPVSSTADLLAHSKARPDKTALLIGYPDFDYAPPDASRQQSPLPPASSADAVAAEAMWGDMRAGVTALAGMKREVEDIHDDLIRAGWRVPVPYEQDRAMKGVLLSAQHPAVVHLATHGFFLQQGRPAVQGMRLFDNLMSGSGLLFTGANHTMRGESRALPSDDGVLTATEVLGLDLAGTQLVVLSACDTGLGQEATGGEIFGLRRAFQIAGAESILMSLWEVNDGETANLMRIFYREWLRTGDKFLALKSAAKEERKTHPEPYYWAGFVLYSGQ